MRGQNINIHNNLYVLKENLAQKNNNAQKFITGNRIATKSNKILFWYTLSKFSFNPHTSFTQKNISFKLNLVSKTYIPLKTDKCDENIYEK